MTREQPREWWRPAPMQGREGLSAAPAGESPGKAASAVPFWALLAFTFVLLLAPQALFPSLAPLHLALLAAGAAILTHLLDRLLRREPILRLHRELAITAGLIGWALVTLPFSYWPGGSLSFLFALYFKTLAIFWLLSATVDTVPKLRQVAWALSLMAIPLAATAVSNFLSGSFLPEANRPPKRIVGYEAPLTENPNDLALMLNLILPLSIALFLGHRRIFVRLLLLGIILLAAAAVIVTFSRAGFLTLATILALYLWKLRRRPERGWAWAAIGIGLLCIPLLPSGYVERLGTIARIEADSTGSAQARWSDTVAGARFVLENPILGAGVGMNVLALNEERGAAWKAVHNVYLQYALELGFPGFALFVWLFAECLRSARSARRRLEGVEEAREVFHLAGGIEVSLLAFAVAALFHPVGYHFYFYYLAGLAVALKGIGGPSPVPGLTATSKRPAAGRSREAGRGRHGAPDGPSRPEPARAVGGVWQGGHRAA